MDIVFYCGDFKSQLILIYVFCLFRPFNNYYFYSPVQVKKKHRGDKRYGGLDGILL